jgi:hypothetical protein
MQKPLTAKSAKKVRKAREVGDLFVIFFATSAGVLCDLRGYELFAESKPALWSPHPLLLH